MKKIRLMLTMVALCISMVAAADLYEPKFSQTAGWEDFDYFYLSPKMLAMMPDGGMSKELYGLSNGKLKLVEVVRTKWFGKKKELNNIVESLVKEKGMERISFQKKDKVTFIWYVDGDDKGNVKRILVIRKKNWDDNFKAIYMVGNLTTDDIKTMFEAANK